MACSTHKALLAVVLTHGSVAGFSAQRFGPLRPRAALHPLQQPRTVVASGAIDLAANATAFAQLANWLQGGGSKCPSALDTSREVDGPGARAVLKIHSKRLNETVLNWNVVVKTLTGTEFERFLHDDA